MKPKKSKMPFFEKAAASATRLAGSTPAIVTAFTLILIWLCTGPVFNYSEAWQLVINTGTTIITFLMVFLIQRAQNKESAAIQLKLNELVASNEHASNRLVSVEDMTEDELKVLKKYYSKLALLSKKEQNLQQSHSIEEAEDIHERKKETKGSKVKVK
ncbi:MAG: low affinity iron permease family protein [Fimbriimonadaceae bacterium]|nr:low affinity iron permease family protein [Chitinophagales bacterium]